MPGYTEHKSQISFDEYELNCQSRGYVKLSKKYFIYAKFNGSGYTSICEYKEGYVNVFSDLFVVRDKDGNGLFITSTSKFYRTYTIEDLNKLLNEWEKNFKELFIQMQKEHIEEMFK